MLYRRDAWCRVDGVDADRGLALVAVWMRGTGERSAVVPIDEFRTKTKRAKVIAMGVPRGS